MLSTRGRRFAAALATPCIAISIALPAASNAAAATAPKPAAIRLGGQLTLPKAQGTAKQMIVILKNQDRSLGFGTARRADAIKSSQTPIISALSGVGIHPNKTLSLINAVVAKVAPNQVAALRRDPAVARVVANAIVHGPAAPVILPTKANHRLSIANHTSSGAGSPTTYSCSSGAGSSSANPELDPEAISAINATNEANNTNGIDGQGVTVAYMAEGIDTSIADFQRNPAYDGGNSSLDRTPVITQQDFSGDGTAAATPGGEAFLDASSIAAQGNTSYDLNNVTNGTSNYLAVPLATDCFIKIVGAAPGANVVGLRVFSTSNDSTTSGFVQAIQWAVSNGVQVLNQSFGANNFPDGSADAIKMADDAATAAGVTVVVSSGDAGVTSTIGSPATDPNVIAVGASTTFRAYEQYTYGGADWPGATGGFIDNNISSLSSSGFAQNGKTVDLVAPGDLNWALCSTSSNYTDCGGYPIMISGGTSEAAPLTAAAAADVIQAYKQANSGAAPTPALVKQILESTATDISTPADQQGFGLLNVDAAVTEAENYTAAGGSSTGGLVVTSGQINEAGPVGGYADVPVTVANTSNVSQTVNLSTRQLSPTPYATQTGSFCMQPGTPTVSCPANTGTITIWSGYTEVYQQESFNVPSGVDRLNFSADYSYSGQTSLLHVALFDPSGNYAGYSLPQGLGDYSNVQVAEPAAGTWTAVFFTVQDGGNNVGTSGTIQWSANSYQFQSGDTPSVSSVSIPPGSTGSFSLDVANPINPGDTSESLVLNDGSQTITVPVTVRTYVPVNTAFTGTLTGGNGRAGSEAQTNTYQFNVPPGQSNMAVSLALTNDPSDQVIATLVDPNGQTVAADTNYTSDSVGDQYATPWVDVYHNNPMAGTWTLVLQWAYVTGNELSQPFTGTIQLNRQVETNNLPNSASTVLKAGKAYSYHVNVTNNGAAPEAFFVDPRTTGNQTIALPNQNGSVDASSMTLPLASGLSFPYYIVPPDTSQVSATLNGSAPVAFDFGYFSGDPEPYATSACTASNSATGSVSAPEGVTAGLWYLNPSECGPYGPNAAPAVTASATVAATTRKFDSTVSSTTGDLWSLVNGLSSNFSPLFLDGNYSSGTNAGTVGVTITPPANAKPGTVEHGVLYLDDVVTSIYANLNGDQIQAIPYSYKVGNVPGKPTNVKATAGNASATLKWTAPANNESAITSYIVTIYKGTTSTTRTFHSAATTEKITSLTNGTKYSFAVAAVNGFGTGPLSSKSNTVTPLKPASKRTHHRR